MGILDQIADNNLVEILKDFSPKELVNSILARLDERERSILGSRFGLSGLEIATLEVIGKRHSLTRERVRQIEKSTIKLLKETLGADPKFAEVSDHLISLVNDHGGLMTEDNFFAVFQLNGEEDRNSFLFVLHLNPKLRYTTGTEHVKAVWISDKFHEERIHGFLEKAVDLLGSIERPVQDEELFERIGSLLNEAKEYEGLNHKTLKNIIHSSKKIHRNSFGDYGLIHWSDIKPKDVGDKAYLTMKHHKKPEHYSVITDLINKNKFDDRKAFKETVHNELIKDKRFVLVGRGIYALAEWGYKAGVVADVITDILKEKGQPLTKEQIIDEVSKRRLVQRNTILVGLSNKKLFKKVGKNMFTLANTEVK